MTDWTNSIHTGDCLDVLEQMPLESVHAIVTDPPYGLAFMGRDWDDFEPREYQEWCEQWASAAQRVLKPGGHILAFSGNRTHHRLFSGVEDAGYEVRDTLTWHYGSGFPKALDVSKAIDKQADADREVLSTEYKSGGDRVTMNVTGNNGRVSEGASLEGEVKRTAPATDAAKRWDGWKTALKPGTEFIVLARKPLSEGTVAENVQEWGTGALNVDGCRVDTDESLSYGSENGTSQSLSSDYEGAAKQQHTEGRYPSNVVFDEQAAAQLDREVGDTSSGGGQSRNGDDTESVRYTDEGSTNFAAKPGQRRGDNGGPSRYFYTSKATKSERTLNGRIANAHPTVKPQDLMKWLVRLVTAEGQTVLDPFVGSGTTCAAAKEMGRQFIGIEKQAKWADVARVRVGLTPDDPSRVRDDESQHGLEAFTDGGDADD